MIGYSLRRLSQVPANDGWLTAAERRWFNDRRSAKRVADWRLGRWTAKAVVDAFLQRQGRPARGPVEILAADDGAPEALAGGSPLPVSLSISHSHGRAVCAAADAGVALGCDIERVEPRSAAFVDSYFTHAESAALAAAERTRRDLLANLIWSAKESALKALRQGLRADTRSMEVTAGRRAGQPWGRLEVASPAAAVSLAGRWARIDDLVLTIVSRPATAEIVELA